MSSGDLALYQQLDSQLTSLADEFSNLVRAAGAGVADDLGLDPAAGGRAQGRRQVPGELLEALTEKLLAAGHQCIHTVSQLKRGAMLSDFSSLIQNVRATRHALDHQSHQVSAELGTMRQEVQQLLNELEAHYYSSAHKGPPPPPPPNELAELCAQALQQDGGWPPYAVPAMPAPAPAPAAQAMGPPAPAGPVGGAAQQ